MTGDVAWEVGRITRDQREAATGGPGATVWFTGLSGSGKSTVACGVEERLLAAGRVAYVLDGDSLRHGLNQDLGFSAAHRAENVRRVAEVARLLADAGAVALVSLISPYASGRAHARRIHAEAGLTFIEVWMSTPLEVCEHRDPKGLYTRARRGELSGFTGIDDPYEIPERPDVVVPAHELGIDEGVHRVLAALNRAPRRPTWDGEAEIS